MTEAEKIIADLKRLEPRLREEGVAHLAIFGSRARGDHRPDSDLDVLVDIQKGIKFSLIDLATVMLTIQDELGIETNIVTAGSLRPRFKETIEADVRQVF
jgi:uncharacterized protein